MSLKDFSPQEAKGRRPVLALRERRRLGEGVAVPSSLGHRFPPFPRGLLALSVSLKRSSLARTLQNTILQFLYLPMVGRPHTQLPTGHL